MQKDAECSGDRQHFNTVCSGRSCEGVVNRERKGVEACLSMVLKDTTCGEKWFEVGDNWCFCYPKHLLECHVVNDQFEDLYQIGEIFWQ